MGCGGRTYAVFIFIAILAEGVLCSSQSRWPWVKFKLLYSDDGQRDSTSTHLPFTRLIFTHTQHLSNLGLSSWQFPRKRVLRVLLSLSGCASLNLVDRNSKKEWIGGLVSSILRLNGSLPNSWRDSPLPQNVRVSASGPKLLSAYALWNEGAAARSRESIIGSFQICRDWLILFHALLRSLKHWQELLPGYFLLSSLNSSVLSVSLHFTQKNENTWCRGIFVPLFIDNSSEWYANMLLKCQMFSLRIFIDHTCEKKKRF